MSKVLTTFSGKFGDILFSLATVRAIYQMVGGEKVDMGIMPAYRSLLPLLNYQSYIDKAFVIEDWECTGSPYGDQPWCPPDYVIMRYDRCFHLTYRMHPGNHRAPIPLIDFTAEQQGIKLRDPIPFIEAPKTISGYEYVIPPIVAYAFNDEASEMKARFMGVLRAGVDFEATWLNLGLDPWLTAAVMVRDALCFVGNRSSNHALAHGVGQKNMFIYEPDISRHAHGRLGITFGTPYTEEKTHPWGFSPEEAAVLAVEAIRGWQEQRQAQEVTK